MKIFRTLLFLFFTCAVSAVGAQDIHYTLFNMSPMTINPALTGSFFGTVRIGGLYRNQAFSVNSFNDYSTPSVYIDAPIIRGFRKNDWVGVGISFVSDKAGILGLSTTRTSLSASYHLALDRKSASVLTLGFQAGNFSRKYDTSSDDIEVGETIVSTQGGGGLDTASDGLLALTGGDEAKKAFNDYTIGLLFRNTSNKTTNLEIGFATGYLSQQRYTFPNPTGATSGDDVNKHPLLFSAHAKLEMPLQGKWSIAPTVYWQGEGSANEILLQAWAGYMFKETADKSLKLNFGLGYRFGDALNILLGADVNKNLKLALAYDITLSDLNKVNKYSGGVEIAAWYIITKYKKPVVKPKVLCPRF